MQALIATIIPGAALWLAPLPTTPPAEGVQLATRYESIEVVEVTREVKFGMQTTAMELEVDGEIQEGMDRMLGGTSTSVRSVHKDDILKVNAEGMPTHIQRTFAGIQSKRTNREGNLEDMEASPREPAEGLVLDIQVGEEGEQKIKIIEGEAPENEAFMAQQPMVFAIDGLLPNEAVEVDGTWELENEDIRRALGEWSPSPRPRPEGERQRRRDRDEAVSQDGRRRQGMRRMGGNIGGFLRTAEWEGQATLVGLKSEFEGGQFALIELEFKTEGDLPEAERGGFGGRRRGGDDQVQPSVAAPKALEGEAEVRIKGKLYFDVEAGRPIAVLLEGELGSTFSRSMDRGERQISMYSEQEGELELTFRFAYQAR